MKDLWFLTQNLKHHFWEFLQLFIIHITSVLFFANYDFWFSIDHNFWWFIIHITAVLLINNILKRPFQKIKVLASETHPEWSDGLHTLCICNTHEFYRLRTFQNDSATLALQIWWFLTAPGYWQRWGACEAKSALEWHSTEKSRFWSRKPTRVFRWPSYFVYM